MKYCELQVTTNFSFLRGASHPHELVEQAATYGYNRIAITDRNTLAGIVRAHAAAKQEDGFSIIPAARLDLVDGASLLVYPTDADAYARLSNLLTLGNRRTEKGKCELYKADVYAHAKGMKCIAIPPATLDEQFELDPLFSATLGEYKEALGSQLYIAITRRYTGDDQKQLFRITELAAKFDVPLVATNDVHYHHPSRRQLQDVLTCVREKCTIYDAGYRLHPNAERHLKTQDEMLRLFRNYPDAIKRTLEIAAACSFSLNQLKYEYPEEIITEGRTPQEEITHLAWKGAKEIFGEPLPPKVINAINHELKFIREMNYASYFLTVYDIVRYARSKGILCQGRGSAANSTVCFCLGITSVNPEKFDLLFERFISAARNEPPDIDVDFEHERREEVMQYIFEKYGRDRAAIVATVTTQHHKGAINDVGKVMGLSLDTIKRVTSYIWHITDDWFEPERLRQQGLDPADHHLQKVLELTKQYVGFPRQLGQHTGGFVITKGKLSDLCPILNARMKDRTNIEWNKDDIDVLGFMKIDVLALGMLTCVRKAFELAKLHYGLDLTLANIPQDDASVYDMISRGETIGVFQIESRAQQSMLPRLKPKCFYDLVIEVAIVRPGPIQGDMVHPYLRRRNGEEAIEYPSEELKEILGRTLGVPLFQEQAMKIAVVAAGFTPAEADELRRSMATFKMYGVVGRFHDKLIKGMLERGYTLEYAEKVFKQLEGFGSYGFPESHAASFALIAYVSAWLKHYYPDVFSCALLNSYPMGFYAPAQVVIDAQQNHVQVRPVDINYSHWDNVLEEKDGRYHALRLGFRQVKGIRQEDVMLLVTNRSQRYTGIHQLRNIGISDATLEILADADAFRSIGLSRREALWDVTTRDTPQQMFKGQRSADETGENVTLPTMSDGEEVLHDYSALGLSVKGHPVHFIRSLLEAQQVVCAKDLKKLPNGAQVKVAGLVLNNQRPETASGVCFSTLEDETGTVNLVIFAPVFDRYRKEIMGAKLLMAEGTLQVEGTLIHLIVNACFNASKALRRLRINNDDPQVAIAFEGPNEQSFPKPRNYGG